MNFHGKKNLYKTFFCRDNFIPFLSKKVRILDHFLQLLFAKDSEYLKSLDIGLQEVGAKRPLNRVNEQTNTQNKNKKEIAKSFVKKNKKCAFRKLKSLSELKKLRDDDNFFLSAGISFKIFGKNLVFTISRFILDFYSIIPDFF